MKQSSDPGLVRTQRWMQAFIMADGVHEEAIRAPQVQAEIPADDALQLVLPSATLTPLERVGIYREMYLGRLGEALEVDYPGVLHFLGKSDFYDLVAQYTDEFPSRSYTLNRLGDRLPDFISRRSDLRNCDFLHELARLELALTEVFDAVETPVLTPEQIAAVPADAWETAVLKPVAAFRLLEFQYPVSQYLGAVDEENEFPKIRRKRTWLVGYRKNFLVHRIDLKRPAYELLKALAAGTPVGQAVAEAKVKEKDLFEWFREWTAERLFQSVELSPTPIE